LLYTGVQRYLSTRQQADLLQLLSKPGAVLTDYWTRKENGDGPALHVEWLLAEGPSRTLVKAVARYASASLLAGTAPGEPLPPQQFGPECNDVLSCPGHLGFTGIRIIGEIGGRAVHSDIGPYTQLGHKVGVKLLGPVWDELLHLEDHPSRKQTDVLDALNIAYQQLLVEWLISTGTHLYDDSAWTVVTFTDRSGRPLVGVITGKAKPEYGGAASWLPDTLSVYHAHPEQAEPGRPDPGRRLYPPIPIGADCGARRAVLRDRLMAGVDGLRRGLKGPHRQ
jgi:hypothetical protein